MQHHNYTYIDTVCPDCESNIILRDNHREETYCTRCGYIIQDNTQTPITDITYPDDNNNGSFMGGRKRISNCQIRTDKNTDYSSLYTYCK